MPKKVGFYLSLVSLLIAGFIYAGSVDLERREYDNVRDIALLILKKYPPEQYNYVGVGRSMTPVITLLQLLHPEQVRVLPLSNMYYHPTLTNEYLGDLSPEIQERLFNHFERFLPSKEQTKGKKVLFLDFVVGGGSAVSTEAYLSKFAKERRPDVKVEMLIFSPVKEPEKIKEAGKNFECIWTQPYEVLNQRWLFSWFDGRSEYGSFSFPFMGSQELKPNHNRERQKFLQHYRAYIKEDPLLRHTTSSCPNLLKRIGD